MRHAALCGVDDAEIGKQAGASKTVEPRRKAHAMRGEDAGTKVWIGGRGAEPCSESAWHARQDSANVSKDIEGTRAPRIDFPTGRASTRKH